MAEGQAKVFVVEDDDFLKDILGQRLAQEFDTKYATDGKSAIEEIPKENPDVILLDLLLPGETDGFAVLKHIRENEQTKETPVIILSNLGQQEDIDKGKELGANDFLIKSNSPIDDVINKIKEYL